MSEKQSPRWPDLVAQHPSLALAWAQQRYPDLRPDFVEGVVDRWIGGDSVPDPRTQQAFRDFLDGVG